MINFVKASGSTPQNSNNVTWNTNPIYKSPESAGISWYDQATHWDPASEGIFSISQSSTDNPVPYWASRDKDLQGVRNQWNVSENQATANAIAAQSSSPSTSGLSTIAPSLVEPETQAASRLSTSKDVAKVASGIATAGQVASSVGALTGPVGVALAINSALGSATAGAIDAGNKSTIASDYAFNAKQQGSSAGFQANLIRDLDTAHSQITASGAQIGGLAGPLGAWFGSLIANAIQDSEPKDNYSDLKTGYSFEGRFNPQDTGAVNTQSTANLSGETNLISNV